MDYSDLRNKTIFDFCKDKEMLIDLTISKDGFLKDIKRDPLINAFVLLEYAEKTNNKELYQAVEKEYEDDFKMFFNE